MNSKRFTFNFFEKNSVPSVACFEPLQPDSVRNRLVVQDVNDIKTNGHSCDTLQEFSSFNRRDPIDCFGIATKILSESAAKYSQSGLRRQLYKQSQLKTNF